MAQTGRPTTSPTSIQAALAVTRFGLGARPGEIDRVGGDARGWLHAQVRPQGAPQPRGDFDDSGAQNRQYIEARRERGEMRAQTRAAPPQGAQGMAPSMPSEDPPRDRADNPQSELRQETGEEFLARAQLGAETPDGFAERWALFWANAFTTSATKFTSAVFMGQYEREAIRPHVFGRFEDLAVAAEQHPAMLMYLDQAQSVGPNSPAGERRNAGLNENLAREILELHTVGADGGYTQADVTELARALTGWSVPTAQDARQAASGRHRGALPRDDDPTDAFVFRQNVHEPGERTVMGKRYPAGGEEQGEAILRDLANRPQTAARLSRRIAQHFVADAPPPALVSKLERAWTSSGGRLDVVAKALIDAPESWQPQALKIKSPYEFVISTHRALNTTPQRVQPLRQALDRMGQPLYTAPSPEGWPDTAGEWIGPDAMVKRLDWAKTVGDVSQASDPRALAGQALGSRLSERTAQAIARAESRPEGVTLFLMSPEFQRR